MPEPWWRGATFYQAYVRSWKDSDGDGIGDLTGLRQGLDYLSWLGVDALWLSPTMPSPNRDWGYDVSDYRDVHPDLGTLDDLDGLVADAERLGIRLLLDLVPNHTSDAHPWFVDARSGRSAAHRDWYVWADPAPDGGPPNNWVDSTGRCAWELDRASGQYYLHNFLASQPDLNWWNPAVREEMEAVLRFWFERGVAGFRVDVAHGLYKDAELRDNPPAGPGDPPPTVRHGLRTVYSARRPEVHDLYRRWRVLADGYRPPRIFLGETWEFEFDRLAAYYGDGTSELNLCFNFPFVFAELTSRGLAEPVEGALAAFPPQATPVWTASNHDVGRFPTRWAHGDPSATRAALVVLATLPGTLVLYYGDELGMPDVPVPRPLQLDEMTAGEPGQCRDRARTPMPWSATEGAGFCPPGVRPWLPFGDLSVNVEAQRDEPGSMLSFTRHLLALRRKGQAGGLVPLERVHLDDQVWAYRVGPVVTAANLSPREATLELPRGEVVADSTAPASPGRAVGGPATLGPWQALVLATD